MAKANDTSRRSSANRATPARSPANPAERSIPADPKPHGDLPAIAFEIDDSTAGLASAADLCERIVADADEELVAIAHGAEALIREAHQRIQAAVVSLGNLSSAEQGGRTAGHEERAEGVDDTTHDAPSHAVLWAIAGDLESAMAPLSGAHHFVAGIASGDANPGHLAYGADALMEKALSALRTQVDRLYDVARSER